LLKKRDTKTIIQKGGGWNFHGKKRKKFCMHRHQIISDNFVQRKRRRDTPGRRRSPRIPGGEMAQSNALTQCRQKKANATCPRKKILSTREGQTVFVPEKREGRMTPRK